MMRLAATLALPALVSSHGAIVNPPPRQAVDKDLKPWAGTPPKVFPNVESKTGSLITSLFMCAFRGSVRASFS